jgi:hypothetical protein
MDAPVDAKPHPHALHVALERKSLSFVSAMLNGVPNVMTMFLRPEKHGMFFKGRGYSMYCPTISGQDIARYNLKSGPRAIPAGAPPVWFAHDSLPYLSPSTIGSWFDRYPGLRTLVCTGVLPVEHLTHSRSRFPEVYKCEYRPDGSGSYEPEGDEPGTYWQPTRSAEWLESDTLITPSSECIHVARVHNAYAHNVFVFSRPQILPQKRRSYSGNKMVMIPLRSAPFWTPEQRLTDKELLRRLIGFSQRNKHIDNQHLKVALAAQANAHDAKYNSQVQEAAVAGAFYAAMCTPTAAPQPAQRPQCAIPLPRSC